MDTLELAQKLIRIESVTPKDGGCMDLIIEQLQPLGFIAERLAFGEGAERVDNLWLRLGTAKPLFCFLGHTDVVPTGPESHWHYPPFAATARDGWLHGRGAADMKSGIAAMVGACRQFLQEAPLQQGSIALLLTSDEEGPAVNGVAQVVQMLKQRGDIPDWTLVCEPSSKEHPGDRIRVGRRGSLHGHLVITGLQGHVAYPHAVRNPIHGVGRFIDALAGQDFSRDEQDFPPTSLQITNINAGTGALNVVPGELRADFNLRYSPQITATEIQQTVERLLVQQVGAHLDARIDWVQAAAPFYSKSGLLRQAAVTAIQQVTGEAPEVSTSGGTSDGRFMQPAGSEVIELGPSAATIHQIDERIRIDSLAVIEDCYLQILKLLFRPST